MYQMQAYKAASPQNENPSVQYRFTNFQVDNIIIGSYRQRPAIIRAVPGYIIALTMIDELAITVIHAEIRIGI